jgi:hypothetical protein
MNGPACSTGSINLIFSSDFYAGSFGLGTGTKSKQTIPSSQLLSRFKPSVSGCLVETYRIVTKDSDVSYSLYKGSDVYLDSSKSIIVDTSVLMAQTLYLEASSSEAVSYAYLPLNLEVTNLAPEFTNGAPSA